PGVAESFIARAHRAGPPRSFGAFGGHPFARPAAVRRGEADEVAAVVIADRGECAERVALDHDARATAQRDEAVGVGERQEHRAQRHDDYANRQAADAGPQVSNPHRRAARPSNWASLSSTGIVSVDATWQHERV